MKQIKNLLFSLLLISASFFSSEVQAQTFTSTVPKVDTALVRPKASQRFAINKLDDQLVFWDKASWKTVAVTLSDTATFDFASSGATTVSDLTKTITGAKLGDEVIIGAPHGSVTATGSFFGWVSATNTVTVRFSPKATENPASGVFHISVLKRQKYL